MFDSPTIEDMKARPQLEETESVRFTTGAKLGDVFRNNVVMAITTDRLLVREKRGRGVNDENKEHVGIEIQLSDIDTIRRTGILTKTIEIVCGNNIYELPPLQNDSGELVEGIVEQEGLNKTDWGEESRGKRGSKQLIGGSLGIVGLLIGGIVALVGFAGIITLAGILLGIPLLIGGGVIGYASWKLIEWGFSKEEEWIRESATGS